MPRDSRACQHPQERLSSGPPGSSQQQQSQYLFDEEQVTSVLRKRAVLVLHLDGNHGASLFKLKPQDWFREHQRRGHGGSEGFTCSGTTFGISLSK